MRFQLFTKEMMSKNASKKRFTDEQIQFLEVMFESESRPESRIKHQLASEVGLQPRQVAIWFQNRRARLKSKQIEREYNLLKAKHDALASNLDSLKRENQALLAQLQKLKEVQAAINGSRSCRLFGQTEMIPLFPRVDEEDESANDQNKDEVDITDGSMFDWHDFEWDCFQEQNQMVSSFEEAENLN